MLYGRTDRNRVSRFVKEIPSEYIEKKSETDSGTDPERSSNDKSGKFGDVKSMSLQKQLAMKKSSGSAEDTVYSPGDRVSHKIFGEGTVISANSIANDTLLEIAFDSKGTKKIMANFAKIKKV